MGTDEHTQCELVLDARASLGEGPVWDATSQTLLWVDIDRDQIHRFDPATGSDTALEVEHGVTAVAIRRDGGLVAATLDGFALVTLGGDRANAELVSTPEGNTEGVRMNDGKCDPAGRFWAGSMSVDESSPDGSLYVLEPDLTMRTVLSGLTISNGLGWSPAGTSMYHIDSPTRAVTALDYDLVSGEATRPRDLVQVASESEIPDGMAVDADGCLWVAFWGGHAVRCYSPAGELLAVVDVPAEFVTSCCFGGRGLTDLYITSAAQQLSADEVEKTHAGGVFRVSPGVRGLAVAHFAG